MAPTSRWDANFVEKNAQGRNAEPIAGVANKTCRRGERPLFSPVNSETITKTLNCSAAVSESGDTVETKRAAHRFSAIKMRSLNDARRGSLPTVLLHLDQVQTGHPSPSAHQFRLPFNWLAPSELRRIFCSDEGAGAAIDKLHQ
jgi:hypothetical protein